MLSTNPSAIHLLEQNPDKIFWRYLSENPSAIHMFSKLDTNKMKQNNKAFAEELVAYVLNPLRLNRLCIKYEIELDELVEMCW
jgi:adenylate kinase